MFPFFVQFSGRDRCYFCLQCLIEHLLVKASETGVFFVVKFYIMDIIILSTGLDIFLYTISWVQFNCFWTIIRCFLPFWRKILIIDYQSAFLTYAFKTLHFPLNHGFNSILEVLMLYFNFSAQDILKWSL